MGIMINNETFKEYVSKYKEEVIETKKIVIQDLGALKLFKAKSVRRYE
jgi:hypothetical protein